MTRTACAATPAFLALASVGFIASAPAHAHAGPDTASESEDAQAQTPTVVVIRETAPEVQRVEVPVAAPTLAEPRGIVSGDRVRMFNDRGSCTLMAEVDGEVRSGVVSAPSVRWNKLAPEARNVNALTSDRLTDIGGGPTFYSCLVEVEKYGD